MIDMKRRDNSQKRSRERERGKGKEVDKDKGTKVCFKKRHRPQARSWLEEKMLDLIGLGWRMLFVFFLLNLPLGQGLSQK